MRYFIASCICSQPLVFFYIFEISKNKVTGNGSVGERKCGRKKLITLKLKVARLYNHAVFGEGNINIERG